MAKFKQNAQSFGAEFVTGKVAKVDQKGSGFVVTLGDGTQYECRTVIMCSGTVPRELGIPGEAKFLGRGLSTCATCDAPLFKNKVTAVIGGGNAAVEGALELAQVGAKKAYLVHRRNEFRADEITVDKAKKSKLIEFTTPWEPVEIQGDKFVTGLKIKNADTKEEKILELQGVFKEIGHVVDISSIKHLVKVNERNEVIIDAGNRTSVPGIFAAGDLTTVPYKQTVISAGEGAKAALSCYQWLSGAKTVGIDWDIKGKK
jgi:alkyl hydroperoxide reductase subunit F